MDSEEEFEKILNFDMAHNSFKLYSVSPKWITLDYIPGYYISNFPSLRSENTKTPQYTLYSSTYVPNTQHLHWILLMRAVQFDSPKIVSKLLDYGSNPYQKDELGNDSFQIGSIFHSKKSLKVLNFYHQKNKQSLKMFQTKQYRDVLILINK